MTRTTNLLITILFLCTSAHFSYATVECGGLSCPSTNSCCNDLVSGYRCYDSSLYECAVNAEGQSVLCSLGFDACGDECYNSTQFICEAGEILCGYHKGQAILACGDSCYDTSSYSCCDGLLYAIGFAPSSCTSGSNTVSSAGPLFCSAFVQQPCALGACCNGICFNPTTQTCYDDQLCPLGNEVCGQGLSATCFDPSTQECCNSQLYPYGTSVCSEASATCCTCPCSSTFLAQSGSFTVGSSSQCNAAYIASNFPSFECPGNTVSCTGSGSTCNSLDCGSEAVFFSHCEIGANGCEGDGYCAGGNFSCSVSANAECAGPVSTSSESAYNTTQVAPGTTPYEHVPIDYAGQVCCWCSSQSGQDATSAPVPNVGNCNPEYLAQNDYFTATDAVCQVWSYDQFDTAANLACGLPQS